MSEESKPAVLAAMGANFAIAAGKLVAGVLTGSAAMLAEAGHSFADTVNQVFLLVGINLSNAAADEKHPHGYGKEAFFWSFLAAIFIFVAGAAFSFYEGIRTLIHPHPHERSHTELAIAFGVLGMAFIFELASFAIAIRGLLRGARRRNWSIVRYIRQSPDLTTKTVFFEDGAALTGLALAALGLFLSQSTGDESWDGIASVGIGVVLTIVAFLLGLQARNLLIGASAGKEVRDAIDDCLRGFPEVERVVRLLTMQLGAHAVLVNGELQLRRNITLDEAEDLLRRLDAQLAEGVPEVVDTFWELRGP
ncbi:cation diffusion facilitator family transporter [Candidatus Amarobacter glycogenicus]|uniref:cation diffusion facilitator family transporter n=1 Tax=Candidatus Amarobacter glycogenicus TaxID=3140699 RepID=UPI002A17B4E2|nr:cation diffusion facilitator family transporter [Dehalococcoidia bacterium]